MKVWHLFLVAVTTLTLSVCVPGSTAQAQVSRHIAIGPTISSIDRDYDFDVYARSRIPTTKYFIVYILSDGSTQEVGPISTYDMASREIYFNFEHDLAPPDSVDADIEARPVLDPFVKFDRYDTYHQALNVASQLETYGLETDVRWIRSIVFNAKASKRSRYSP